MNQSRAFCQNSLYSQPFASLKAPSFRVWGSTPLPPVRGTCRPRALPNKPHASCNKRGFLCSWVLPVLGLEWGSLNLGSYNNNFRFTENGHFLWGCLFVCLLAFKVLTDAHIPMVSYLILVQVSAFHFPLHLANHHCIATGRLAQDKETQSRGKVDMCHLQRKFRALSLQQCYPNK